MNLIPLMRTTDNQLEIAGLFKELMLERGDVMIWQNSGDDKRVIHHGRVEEVSIKERIIKIAPQEEDESFYFKKHLSLYIHGKNHSIIFKSETRYMKGGRIVLPFPDEAKVLEKRMVQRMSLEHHGDRHVVFTLDGKPVDESVMFGQKLTDISMKGVGMEVTGKVTAHIEEGLTIQFVRLCGHQPLSPIPGKIKYVQEDFTKSRGNSRVYKIGVEFDNPLDDVTLQTIFEMGL